MEPTLEQVAARVGALEEAHKQLDAKVDENTELTSAVKSDTALLLEFTRAYRATKLVGGVLAKFILWISPLVAAGVTLWNSRGK